MAEVLKAGESFIRKETQQNLFANVLLASGAVGGFVSLLNKNLIGIAIGALVAFAGYKMRK
jgi:hypothetical protein